jgi:hypothetical protein
MIPMFGSYSEVRSIDSDYGYSPENKANKNSKNNLFFSCNFDISSNNDIDTVLKNSFAKAAYPVNFTHTNAFCPLCGQFVSDNTPHLTY